MDEYTRNYIKETKLIADQLDQNTIIKMIEILKATRDKNGRLFILGVGGGAGNASHAVNDFRKIAGIETYTPTDNVSELSARVNDDGWETVFSKWLLVSKINSNDTIMIFSVGGGNEEKNVSVNIINAIKLAKENKARIIGIVGRDGGHTAQTADACIIIPPLSKQTITPLTESFQAVVWHLIVSHPDLKVNEMKW